MTKKVAHLVTYCGSIGGAARASYRLHQSLRTMGWHSTMLGLWRDTDDPDVQTVESSERIRECLRREAKLSKGARVGPGDAWSTGLVGAAPIDSHPAVTAADAIMVYWIGQAFVSSGRIGALTRLNKPIVWRLSDMWAFTGGCHYSHGCEGYRRKCGACPQLGSGSSWDISRLGWLRKRFAWNIPALTVVCPSRWMGEQASASSLLSGADVRVISTGVDTSLYRPISRDAVRVELGLPRDRPLLLFASDGGLSAERKGGHLVHGLLERLKAKAWASEPVALVLGSKDAPQLPIETVNMGRINDESQMAKIYAAADVLVAPYLEDNLPNTVLEAMSCGTPTVAFDIGGVRDAVLHGVSGMTVPVGDLGALSDALFELMSNGVMRQKLGDGARQLALRSFDIAKQAQVYESLLSELLERKIAKFRGSRVNESSRR